MGRSARLLQLLDQPAPLRAIALNAAELATPQG